ncbi:cation transport regulator [Enhydrobacter aerosaccus]|uniref:Cation transport regulator n=1 Tax=Enhydrobacter aerosaccus TaxID=225324 RepID=A0A1T4MXM1_9HYPH|nr:ChaB family protein [Enhydrobacter aerosaccus]SJZ71723.1 cation transport regulator [Enhydrobacter aerosaccus]
MPYASTAALPASVRHHLPLAAQEIYREAFNHAWLTYAYRSNREQICHRVAWAAVKRAFHKEEDGLWYRTAAAFP